MNNVHFLIYKKQELTRLPEICKGALYKAWGHSWEWIKNHSDKLIAAAITAIALSVFIGSCIAMSFAPVSPLAFIAGVVGAFSSVVVFGIALQVLLPAKCFKPSIITQKEAEMLVRSGDYKRCGRALIAVPREKTRQVKLGRQWVTVYEPNPGMRACGNYRISG